MEDTTGAQGGDYDYNDLIFAFTSTRADTQPTLQAADVPEPLSLTLLATACLVSAWFVAVAKRGFPIKLRVRRKPASQHATPVQGAERNAR